MWADEASNIQHVMTEISLLHTSHRRQVTRTPPTALNVPEERAPCLKTGINGGAEVCTPPVGRGCEIRSHAVLIMLPMILH